MVEKIDLEGSHVETFAGKVDGICRPLRELLRIPWFRYGRVFNDGSRIVLSNHPDIFRLIYEEGNYPITWHDNDRPISTFQSYLWAIKRLSNTTESELYFDQDISKLFGITQGMSFLNQSADSVEIFSFASDDLGVYDLKRSLLDRFMFYFKEQAQDLIEAANSERIIVPLCLEKQTSNVSEEDERIFHDSTPIKRYHLKGLYRGIYLTCREVECLNWGVM